MVQACLTVKFLFFDVLELELVYSLSCFYTFDIKLNVEGKRLKFMKSTYLNGSFEVSKTFYWQL
jgi:hypothetical protein